jgi:hypothetical protein
LLEPNEVSDFHYDFDNNNVIEIAEFGNVEGIKAKMDCREDGFAR